MLKSIISYFVKISLILSVSCGVNAADLYVGVSREGIPYATLTGEIKTGDGAQFKYLINSWKNKGYTPVIIFLNSPGGAVYESYSIISTVLENGINTNVGPGDICASACVGIFAAGKYRILDPNSKVGVHRISVAGADNDLARSSSIGMIKIYKSLNIPERIRLKMIETDPNEMYFLNKKEKEEFSSTIGDLNAVKLAVKESNIPIKTRTITTGDRKKSRALNESAITYIRSNRYTNAIINLEEANALSPTDAEILGNLGYSYYMVGRYPEAQRALTASLKLKSKRGSSWNNLGLVLSALGNEDWAVDCFVNYWNFSKNKEAATKQFFYWENQRPNTTLDRASKRARLKLGLY